MDFQLINVGIGATSVSNSPNILRTIIGSCVAICLYDSKQKIGGLSHIMLPTSQLNSSFKKKYADTAIPILVKELEMSGVKKGNMVAKLVGGASMFNLSENSKMSKIGRDNVSKVTEILNQYDIKIIARDVGGNNGRTIDFFLENGDIKIKSIGKTIKTI